MNDVIKKIVLRKDLLEKFKSENIKLKYSVDNFYPNSNHNEIYILLEFKINKENKYIINCELLYRLNVKNGKLNLYKNPIENSSYTIKDKNISNDVINKDFLKTLKKIYFIAKYKKFLKIEKLTPYESSNYDDKIFSLINIKNTVFNLIYRIKIRNIDLNINDKKKFTKKERMENIEFTKKNICFLEEKYPKLQLFLEFERDKRYKKSKSCQIQVQIYHNLSGMNVEFLKSFQYCILKNIEQFINIYTIFPSRMMDMLEIQNEYILENDFKYIEETYDIVTKTDYLLKIEKIVNEINDETLLAYKELIKILFDYID